MPYIAVHTNVSEEYQPIFTGLEYLMFYWYIHMLLLTFGYGCTVL